MFIVQCLIVIYQFSSYSDFLSPISLILFSKILYYLILHLFTCAIIYLLFMPLFYGLLHSFTIILLMKHLSINVYATILCLYKIRNDHFVQQYNAVAISFVHRTISRHAAHVAVSFCRDIVRLPYYLLPIFMKIQHTY